MRPRAIKEGRLIEVIGTDKPKMVVGNSSSLESAVRNVVENAIKYSYPATTVTIEVDDDGRICISDIGPGIPSQLRDIIFDRFTKADHRGSGLGLGLSIVRRVVEAHHGSIELGDNPKGGAAVTIRIPAVI